MIDLSHLKALAVTRETTREYTFDRILGDPSVIVSPATDDNEDFQSARLDLSLAEVPEPDPKEKKQSGKPTADELKRQYEENRDIDCRLIAQACVRGWGTPPVDAAGKPIEFSAENVCAWLSALPKYAIDPFRAFCGNIYNFAPSKSAQKQSAEKMGKS